MTVRILQRCVKNLIWLQSILLLSVYSAIAFGQCDFPGHFEQGKLRYHFEPILTSASATLRVTLEFSSGKTRNRQLLLPSEWGGASHLSKAIGSLKAISEGTAISNTADPAVKLLRFPANSVVAISYELSKDWSGLLRHPKEFHAVLEPEFFEFNGSNGLIWPEMHFDTPVTVQMDWQLLPKKWSLATSFGTERCQSFSGRWRDVNQALFAGGDFRLNHTTINGEPVLVAIRGTWRFKDQDAVTTLGKIIGAERKFWHDNDFPYFLVTIAPYDQDEGSTEGTAFTNAFMNWLSRRDSFTGPTETSIAHEVFHAWNPQKIGHPAGGIDAPVAWFYEGFTVYYADLLLYRAGLIPVEEYVRRANEKVRDYEESFMKNISNQQVIERYREQEVNKLPYMRGAVTALWLDGRIVKASGGEASLDNVMFDLLRQSQERSLPLSTERVLKVANKYLDVKSREQLRTYVEKGQDIDLPDREPESCAALTLESMPQFDVGFDRQSYFQAKVLSGVKPDSEAYKAGIRNGEQVSDASIHWNDPNQKVKLTIRRNAEEETVEYLPRGKMLRIPQYQLDDLSLRSETLTKVRGTCRSR